MIKEGWDRFRAAVEKYGLLGVLRRVPSVAGGKGAPRLYRWLIRPLLPRTGYVQYAQVSINREVRFGDRTVPSAWLPYDIQDRPRYESALVHYMHLYVQQGDRVVIIGGGWGATAVTAAKRVGASGQVTVYEAAREYAAHVRRAVEINGVTDHVCVEHATVGPAVAVRGSSEHGRSLPTDALPECDVLEIDCEGAELEILSHLDWRPRMILVEAHGIFGAPTRVVRSKLEEMDYQILDERVAAEDLADLCIERDIRVLAAVAAGSREASQVGREG